MNVQYISHRERHIDTLYKTGPWVTGEVKEVPDDLGRRMLKHADVYSMSKEPASTKVLLQSDEPSEFDKMSETYDLVNAMQEDSIRSFVQTQFGRDLDGRVHDVVKLRQMAIGLVDQYGILK